MSDENLLALLRAARSINIEDDDDLFDDELDGDEVEEEPRQTPEMARATRLCRLSIEMLVKEELLELVSDESLEQLTDYLLVKLMKSRSQQETVNNWIKALTKAREVEDLFGTDEEVAAVINRAFAEVAASD